MSRISAAIIRTKPERQNCAEKCASKSGLPSGVRRQIYGWLDENLSHLIDKAAIRFGLFDDGQLLQTKLDSNKKSPHHLHIHHKVTSNQSVLNFPCLANVLQVTFSFLYDQLSDLFLGVKDEVFLSTACFTMRLYLPPEDKRLHTPDNLSHLKDEDRHNAVVFRGEEVHSVDAVINPAVHLEMANLKQKIHLPHAEQYWALIRFASKFDRDPIEVGNFLVRKMLRLKDKEKLKREHFVDAIAMIAGVRDELEAVSSRADDARTFMNSLHEQIKLRLDQISPDLIAALSMSWALAMRITVVEEKCTVRRGIRACNLVENEGCHRFWESRFLFAGEQSRSKSGRPMFIGVALDTILGKVWNADMTYEHCLCPRKGWSCSLQAVTKDRWDKYVAAKDFSLSAFADDKRFKPRAGIHVNFSNGLDNFSPVGSVLLSPL